MSVLPRQVEPEPGPEIPEHRLSVVVPMYQERDNVVLMVDAIEGALAGYPHCWELLLVDDGSEDGTGELLEQQARRRGAHVRVVRLRRNQGQSAAMQAGIDEARGDVVVTLDGDLQNDPRDIPRVVDRLLRADLDLVAGWRRDRKDALLLRRLPSLLANRLIRAATGLAFHDLGCSLKAFRASVLHQIRLRGEMHRFIPAWLATVTTPARMAEEPVRDHPRRRGRSKYGLSRTFRVIVDLAVMRFFLRYRQRPAHCFGGLGLALAALGLAALAAPGVLRVLGVSAPGAALVAAGAVCLMGATQLFAVGLLAELLIRRPSPAGDVHLRADRAPPLSHDAGWHLPRA